LKDALFLALGNGRLANRADIFGAGLFEDFFGAIDLITVLGVDRDQIVAFLKLLLVRLASISGMPNPIRPPTMPPVVAPMAAPLKAAMIGPAAMKGPTPGIASAPIPASKPSTTPGGSTRGGAVVAPSGALVALT
jgi:hypothetical protein